MTVRLHKDPINIIICGVGGQGNILASELFASALIEKGFYVTVGETYGATQRGGSVMSHVRVSKKHQFGPLIPLHQADIVVGFEPIETLRIVQGYGNKDTIVIYNSRPNYPMGVLRGESRYPGVDEIDEEMKRLCGEVRIVKATEMAIEAGMVQGANIALLGALVSVPLIPLDEKDFESILKASFKGKTVDLNLQLFRNGHASMSAVSL